jgi:guanylate cyclase
VTPTDDRQAASGYPGRFLVRLIAIADEHDDDDDTRLRKRVGVLAGYLTIAAALTLPLQAMGHPISFILGAGLAAFTLANLIVLAGSRRLDRYVRALIAAGLVFVPMATILGGGVLGSTTGLVWGFLVPAYAIMALGPGRATPWFVGYLGIVAVMVAIDPLVRERVPEAPYVYRLVAQVQNTVLPLGIVFLLLRYTDVRRRAAEGRVHELLTNAIPAAIATRLTRGERRIAEAYPATTVVFADLEGFTPWAQATEPARVVAVLDDLFTRFDELAATHGLEKIKTIGDAYMAVAGAPIPRDDHARAAVAFARAMGDAVGAVCAAHGLDLHVRTGIASGPVVAGVIGRQRLLFDLWGETVNLAARMESSGMPGRIHVSASTRDILGDAFSFEPREVDLKGLGRQTTYLIAE